MSKGIKIVLIISLLLNVGLVIGFVTFKSYVKSYEFQLAAIVAQSEASLLGNVLSELESGDPAKITALKERLRKDIEQAQKVKEIWELAATK